MLLIVATIAFSESITMTGNPGGPIEQFISDAALQIEFPASDENIVKLFTVMEYEIDLQVIRDYIDNGYIPCPQMISGKRLWTIADACHLHAALEYRRAWASPSSFHDCKKSQARLDRDRASWTSDDSFESDVEETSLEDLLIAIAESDNRQVRECLHEALRIKLGLNSND